MGSRSARKGEVAELADDQRYPSSQIWVALVVWVAMAGLGQHYFSSLEGYQNLLDALATRAAGADQLLLSLEQQKLAPGLPKAGLELALQAYAQQPSLAVPRTAPALSAQLTALALAETELTFRAQLVLKASDGGPAETRRSLTQALQTAAIHLRSLVQTGSVEARAQRGQALSHLRQLAVAGLLSLALLAIVGTVRRRREARRHQLLTLAVRENNLGVWEWALPDGQFYASPRALELLGVIGTSGSPPDWEWIHPEDRAALHQEVTAALATPHRAHSLDCRLQTRAGEFRWFRLSGTVESLGSGGGAVRWVGSLKDIHEQHLAALTSAESTRRRQIMLDSVETGIAMFDPDNRLVFCNASYGKLFELPPELLLPGTNIDDITRYFYALRPESRGGRTLETVVEARRANLRIPHEGVEIPVGELWYLFTENVLEDGSVIAVRTDISAVKLAQARLSERSELLETALRASSDGLWDWNVETNQNYLSPRWKELLGYRNEDIDNNTSVWQAHIHPDERDMVARCVEQHLDGKGPFDVEYRMRTQAGEWRWFQVRGSVVRDVDGRPRRMAGFTTDIHDRKAQALEIQRGRTLLNEAIEALDAGIARFDADERLVFCNQRFRALYGFSPALAVPGTTARALVESYYDQHVEKPNEQDRRAYVEARLAVQRELSGVLERQVGDRWLLISDQPSPDGGRVSLHTDITDLKKIQTDLTVAGARAEAATQAKANFLANMSHELRTPLNGVIGMLQMLEGAAIASPYNEYVQVALRSGRVLLALINDVLDFSRLESGALTLEQVDFDLREVLADALAAVQGVVQEKALLLNCEVAETLPQGVRGDPLRLRQVLTNLLGNALKFTPKGSVCLSLTQLSEPARIRYAVIDTGIGMTPAQQNEVLERFTQADASTTRRFGGAGLGLSISRQLVEGMQGELHIASTLGVGTKVWFDLPLRQSDHVPSVSTHSAPAVAEAYRGSVLVVDDVETNRLVALAMLQRFGLRVTCVESGAAALKLAANQAFDLALIDCEMPGMDGYATTRALQAQLGLQCPPIVAMTAHIGPEDRARASAAGMQDYVSKPISMMALGQMLARWLPAAQRATVVPAQFQRRAGEEIISLEKFSELRESFEPTQLQGLYAAFQLSMTGLLQRFALAKEARDMPQLQDICHALKGMSSNVGAARIAGLAGRLEGLARRGELTEMDDADALLWVALSEFEVALAKCFKSVD